MVDVGLRDEGEKYNPATDIRTCMSIIDAPSGRIEHTAIWAEGSKNIAVMIIWGGRSAQNEYENSGAWYDPVRDTWKKMKSAGSPLPRRKHTAVWTNTQMIIWGGEVACNNSPWCDLIATGSGGIYDPTLDNDKHVSAWKLTPLSPNATPRSDHAAVWTGSEMIIWGGHGCMDLPNCEWQEESLVTGARLNIDKKTWSRMNTDNTPQNIKNFSAVWSAETGKMIICSGADIAPQYRTRATYDPGKDLWDSNPPRSILCP